MGQIKEDFRSKFILLFAKPLLFFISLYAVFGILLKFNIERYQLFLFLGIILWAYLSESTKDSLKILRKK